ncbi:MAG TPA: prepilin-type N-terminal cleavage/methylation domain-containing protein [Phycisphaerae bacterium]|nr:prepilin-type N-terminal cleavage/methylation domain-containing protein [Phycisphaerae bacterium]HNU44326.1 prepilin-type N-terminal cleavage/methylation domain-containing protein [Phycisphaerae bacterium]
MRAGVTLVELLVVIAVIALLLAILLPSLGQARALARSVQCRSNLRQMAIAACDYANAFADRYPIAYYTEARQLIVSYAWDFTTKRDLSTWPATTVVTPGLLWRGCGMEAIQQCPGYEGAANWLTDPYTGYNYNTSYIGHGQGEAIPAPAMVAQIRVPARTALFGDGQYSAGANKFMRAPWANPGDVGFAGRHAGTQGYRHLKKTNVAFCDAHAETWSERYTDTYPADRRRIAPGTGFLSADNSMYDLE